MSINLCAATSEIEFFNFIINLVFASNWNSLCEKHSVAVKHANSRHITTILRFIGQSLGFTVCNIRKNHKKLSKSLSFR